MKKASTLNITPEIWIDFSEEEKSGKPVTIGLGDDNELLLLVLYGEEDQQFKSGSGIFPKIRADKKQDFKVISHKNGVRTDTWLKDETYNYHFVQRLSSGDLLLANARCSYNGGAPDRHARVFTQEGRFVRDLVLGDGLASLECTGGRIWTTYFDEGIFGNFGWDSPIGSHGVIQWDEHGKRLFSLEDTGRFEVADVYATNVVNRDECWFYYYDEFELVKLDSGKVRSTWDCPIDGAHCLAVAEPFVLMNGGYDRPHTYELLQLTSENVLRSVQPISFEIDSLQNSGFIARGSTLVFVDWDASKVYRHDLTDTVKKLDLKRA